MYAALKALPSLNPRFIFWKGYDYVAAAGSKKKLSKQETLACGPFATIFMEAVRLIPIEILQTDEELDKHRDEHGDIVPPTPHCLRYSFANRFLENGGSMEQLAIALADKLEVVQKHYAKLTKKRTQQVHDIIRQGHAKKAPVFMQAPHAEVGIVAQA
jgi:hypothetical protein